MTDDFHKQGMLGATLVASLGVEDGEGKWESHHYTVSRVVREHPEWLILDKEGKHGRMTRNLAALCPPCRKCRLITSNSRKKFIRDWGYDGSKLDNIYSVPKCYNPAHHHKSRKTRSTRSPTFIDDLPDHAASNEPVLRRLPVRHGAIAGLLPYLDQAVTADPVGATQIRRRIKMYKALLCPDSAVYGTRGNCRPWTAREQPLAEHGEDFASTVGTGVWRDQVCVARLGPHYKEVNLTRLRMTSGKSGSRSTTRNAIQRTFLDLYTYARLGLKVTPSKGWEIFTNAFFAPQQGRRGGELELRGLKPGRYQVTDYADEKTLGVVEPGSAKRRNWRPINTICLESARRDVRCRRGGICAVRLHSDHQNRKTGRG